MDPWLLETIVKVWLTIIIFRNDFSTASSRCGSRGTTCTPVQHCSGQLHYGPCWLPAGGQQGVCCNVHERSSSSSAPSEIIFPSDRRYTPPVSIHTPTPQRITQHTQSAANSGSTFGQYIPPSSEHATATQNSQCSPVILCASVDPHTLQQGTSLQSCVLSDGSSGVVCPAYSTASINPLSQANTRSSTQTGKTLSSHFLNSLVPLKDVRAPAGVFSFARNPGNAVQTAIDESVNVIFRAPKPQQSFQSTSRTTPNDLLFFNHISTKRARNLGMQAAAQQMVLTNLLGQRILTIDEAGSTTSSQTENVFVFPSSPASSGPQLDTRRSEVQICTNLPDPVCPFDFYRSHDGTCNNLNRPRHGSGMTGFKRLLASTYPDGVREIRSRSVLGRPLPSSRLVSERTVETFSKELFGITLSVMQWGQFIDHDFSHQLLFRDLNGEAIQCCLDDGKVFPRTPLHPECIPIAIPENDPFYSRFNQRCMSLVRSMPAVSLDCVGRTARPVNELTAYLDNSNVYGSTEEELDRIRSGRDGLLKTSRGNLLPLNEGQLGEEPRCRGDVCYMSGETRVNEQSGLAVIHTIFHREHNKIVRTLRHIKGPIGDEELFQQARRILIAEYQHIIYNEWLPLIIGQDFARVHGLLPLRDGFSAYYSENIDPSISTEFATAAFRFGHSLVRDFYILINSQGNAIGTINLTRTFFDPSVVQRNFVEHARSLVATRGETFDNCVTGELHEKLFTENSRFGLDLIAINIKRGRDHGIPTYVTMLHACTGNQATHWGHLNGLMSSDAIDRLRAVYADVRDVDLFIGGLLERPVQGAMVGPTFQCLIGQQFFDLRFGDRFFYDNGRQPHSFTLQQLRQIRRSSWARIMCDNAGDEFGGYDRIQPLAFLEPDGVYNPIVHCQSQSIPMVDLSVF